MQLFEPIESIVPRRAQGYGEPILRTVQLARAGLPVPGASALPRASADALYERVLAPEERLSAWLDPDRPLPGEEELAALRERIRGAELHEDLRLAASETFHTLRALGAPALFVVPSLCADRIDAQRWLTDIRFAVDSEERLYAALRTAFASAFELPVLRSLRAAGARDASVAVLVQSLVDGLVSGVVYTRHPITADAGEWLVRAGYGLASGVRRALVPSDVFRVSRDGFVRDAVIADKARMWVSGSESSAGERVLREVPAALATSQALSEPFLRDVLRLAERTERHLGYPVCIDWAIAQSKLYLLRSEALPGAPKIPRTRAQKSSIRERALWSHSEVGEAFPDPVAPLSWSLLQRFGRVGVANVLRASGAALGAAPELMVDVRGRAFLNLGVLTEAVCRIPGVSAHVLSRVGLDLPHDVREDDRVGPIDLARAALRVYDVHVRLGEKLGLVATRMADERGHFAGLDARLLSPQAVQRVLSDAELFLGEAGAALMRVHGAWLVTLAAFRVLFAPYFGAEALRVERDLLWGPDELVSVRSGRELLALGRSLSRDTRVHAWADGEQRVPGFVREALDDFELRHRHEGMLLLDPQSPRWRETPRRLEAALRALLADPMGLAFALEREQIVLGRRERAEREWKRKLPFALWAPATLLIRRLRDLTRQREQLFSDTARAVSVIREIAVDASRRLAMRDRSLGPDAAFFLTMDELHGALARGNWDVRAQVEQRRSELATLSALPPAVARFYARPTHERTLAPPITGIWGSGGSAEGKVFRVEDGARLEQLPRGAVLVTKACDVGLCAVLPAVRAVISEQGGMLSHGAMLASALGVPVVVGVPNALGRLRDGERVRVDADQYRVDPLGPDAQSVPP
ncbi:MAG TPA: PEP/pyruvate-binding domain-containing protein [Polyangiales bacterium]|nr:PEP/pyruvate-binding domain-containing protein [Polyangiales bacterium]